MASSAAGIESVWVNDSAHQAALSQALRKYKK
jgi:hypothetical protein